MVLLGLTLYIAISGKSLSGSVCPFYPILHDIEMILITNIVCINHNTIYGRAVFNIGILIVLTAFQLHFLIFYLHVFMFSNSFLRSAFFLFLSLNFFTTLFYFSFFSLLPFLPFFFSQDLVVVLHMSDPLSILNRQVAPLQCLPIYSHLHTLQHNRLLSNQQTNPHYCQQ